MEYLEVAKLGKDSPRKKALCVIIWDPDLKTQDTKKRGLFQVRLTMQMTGIRSLQVRRYSLKGEYTGRR